MNSNKASEFVLSETYTGDGFECIRCGCSEANDGLYRATPTQLLEWFHARRSYIGALDRQVYILGHT